MKGTVHRYFSDIKMGTIRADSGKKYPFTQADWMSGDIEPQAGTDVLFDVEPGRAVKCPRFSENPETKASINCEYYFAKTRNRTPGITVRCPT